MSRFISSVLYKLQYHSKIAKDRLNITAVSSVEAIIRKYLSYLLRRVITALCYLVSTSLKSLIGSVLIQGWQLGGNAVDSVVISLILLAFFLSRKKHKEVVLMSHLSPVVYYITSNC